MVEEHILIKSRAVLGYQIPKNENVTMGPNDYSPGEIGAYPQWVLRNVGEKSHWIVNEDYILDFYNDIGLIYKEKGKHVKFIR